MNTYDKIKEEELRERNGDIAAATIRWIQLCGYRVAWDGDYFVVYKIGAKSVNGELPAEFKSRHRESAYLKALELAAKA